MMEDLDLIITILAVFFIVRVLLSMNKQVNQPPKEGCPPHKWTYDANEHMFCPVCNKRPGEIGSDYDKPY